MLPASQLRPSASPELHRYQGVLLATPHSHSCLSEGRPRRPFVWLEMRKVIRLARAWLRDGVFPPGTMALAIASESYAPPGPLSPTSLASVGWGPSA